MTKLKPITGQTLIPLVAALGTLGIGVFVSELGLELAISSIALVAVISVIAAVVATLVCKATLAPDSPVMRTSSLPLEYGEWIEGTKLWSDQQLAELERRVECKEIWIVSRNLVKDVPLQTEPGSGLSFADLVEANVTHRCICYRYIVPDTPVVERRLEALLSRYKGKIKDRIEYFKVTSEEWKRLPWATGDFTIFNPTLEPLSTPLQAFFQYPSPDRGLWVPVVDSDILEEWMTALRSVVPALFSSRADLKEPKGESI